MGAIHAMIAALETAPQPAAREPAVTAGGPAHAPGMQHLMALLRQPAAAPPPTPEVGEISRAATESGALAAA